MKWSPVYHVSTIFRNHMTADVLWVKVTLLSAYLQTKWRLKPTCFDGEIESQTRVPPVSSPTCDLSSVLRVNYIATVASSTGLCPTLSEKQQQKHSRFSPNMAFIKLAFILRCHILPYQMNHEVAFEPRPEKTGFLHMRKQRRRSALR